MARPQLLDLFDEWCEEAEIPVSLKSYSFGIFVAGGAAALGVIGRQGVTGLQREL